MYQNIKEIPYNPFGLYGISSIYFVINYLTSSNVLSIDNQVFV